MKRIILHCDMNNFFASVELIKHPELRGKPIAVAGSTEKRNGIILAKSQEAKKLGVKTAEAIWQAKLKCKDLILLEPHYDEYVFYSKEARKIYSSYADRVEAFGIDECWIDISGTEKLFGSPYNLAKNIQNRIKEELKLSISIGISFTKYFAKLASDIAEPNSIKIIRKDNFKKMIWKLETNNLLGVGKATYSKLTKYGIHSIEDLAKAEPCSLSSLLGINAMTLIKRANGIDGNKVKLSISEDTIKSISKGKTFPRDLINEDEVNFFMENLAYNVSSRLIKNSLLACSVQLSVKNSELKSKIFQCPLPYPTHSKQLIKKVSFKLFKSKYSWDKDLRAISIRVINLISEKSVHQINLEEMDKENQKREKMDDCVYKIREKYGKESIKIAQALSL